MSLILKTKLKNGDTLLHKEFKIKHLKVLYKCLLGSEIDSELVIINLYNILQELTDFNIDNLNFLDFFIFLIEIRCSNIGNIINLQLSENNNLELNLDKLLENLKTINAEDILKSEKNNNLEIFYKLPTLKEILFFNENIDQIHSCFLDKVITPHKSYKITSHKEAEKILKTLPVKTFLNITKKVNNIIEIFNNENLLSYNKHIKDVSLIFNFNIKNLILIIKLLFGNHLMSLYENILILCKIHNFTPEYIENCTPGEYFLYIKKVEEINQNKTTTTETPQESSENFEEELVEEEPLNPYESKNLPPVTSQFT